MFDGVKINKGDFHCFQSWMLRDGSRPYIIMSKKAGDLQRELDDAKERQLDMLVELFSIKRRIEGVYTMYAQHYYLYFVSKSNETEVLKYLMQWRLAEDGT